MPKTETRYVCQKCGQDYPVWAGQCQSCEEWNCLVEEAANNKSASGGQAANKFQPSNIQSAKPISITKVDYDKETRQSTGIGEVDRVLGGGVVPGSVVLVSGEPGIGKSTMMLQAAESLSKNSIVLYVSGEESARQIRIRAERLGTLSKDLMLLPETNIFAIENAIQSVKPKFVVIDSIQTMFREDLNSAPGSVSQVRECANYLVRIAKTTHIPIFIVGHVTKEGSIAGPRLLEHIVDTVLYFEGERHKQFRILRANKNRFGSTDEVGIFEMKDKGLIEVTNPSQVFLEERAENASGSVVTAAMEGTRPVLVEIQALVSPTKMVYPNRKCTGVDYNRVSIVIAILEKQLGIKLYDKDVYVNAAGGIKVTEPAMDLPIAMAIISSYNNKPVEAKTVVIGEIGLSGEIRSVSQIEQRVKEAKKLGFTKIISPQNCKKLKEALPG